MHWLRTLASIWRGTLDRDAFRDYKARLLAWAADVHGLSQAEYRADFENRYLDAAGRDLFLDYLVSASKESPSYVTDHDGLLRDRRRLFGRFGLPILTMHELRDKENERLARLDSPMRL